jgi:hypothetical protein
MPAGVIRVDDHQKREAEDAGTFTLKWDLEGQGQQGQQVKCGCFFPRSITSTGPVLLEGSNGGDWFPLAQLDKPGVVAVAISTRYVRPQCLGLKARVFLFLSR